MPPALTCWERGTTKCPSGVASQGEMSTSEEEKSKSISIVSSTAFLGEARRQSAYHLRLAGLTPALLFGLEHRRGVPK